MQVTKAPEEQIAAAMSMNASGPTPSALRVTVPPELQGVAFISVVCQKGNFQEIFIYYRLVDEIKRNFSWLKL